jgi:hypothetical protein
MRHNLIDHRFAQSLDVHRSARGEMAQAFAHLHFGGAGR